MNIFLNCVRYFQKKIDRIFWTSRGLASLAQMRLYSPRNVLQREQRCSTSLQPSTQNGIRQQPHAQLKIHKNFVIFLIQSFKEKIVKFDNMCPFCRENFIFKKI